MATWFATANGNINSAGRWAANPDGSGATLTWPPASGDVLVANGKTITINVNTDLGATGEIRNDTIGGATAGGFFASSTTNGVSLTANIPTLSVTNCFAHVYANTFYIIGNCSALTTSGQLNVRNNSTGTLYITGNVTSTWSSVSNGSSGIINITGTITNSGAAGTYAVDNALGGTVSITGNCTNNGTGSATVVQNRGVGTMNVTGNVIHTGAGTRGAGYNSSTGTLTISGYAQASTTGPGAENTQQGILQVGETRRASNGRGAVFGAFRFASATAAKSLSIIAGTQQTLSVLDVAALVPTVEDVRASVVYGDGAYTGTLALQRKRQTMAGRF